MSVKPEESRGSDTPARSAAKAGGEAAAARAGARQRVDSRHRRYMIMPLGGGSGEEAIKERLRGLDGVELLRSLNAAGQASPVIVARMPAERAEALARSEQGDWLVEIDHPLLAAASVGPVLPMPGVAAPPGAVFTTTIQVLGESDEPIEHAQVQLFGRQRVAEGSTGADGRVALALYGESTETVSGLVVRPRAGYWGVWISRPRLQADGVNAVPLKPLDCKEAGWGERAVRFDRLPAGYGGAGVRIALIDSGVATSHKLLQKTREGFDTSGGKERSWAQDPTGHGTACAGILAAQPSGDTAIRGYAPEAEVHVCRLPADAHCSDLVAALDYCLAAGIDVACLGFGCDHGSAIVERRIVAAKQRGLAMVAAAGSRSGPVQFPACSPHVLAVGAAGQEGSYPGNSPAAAYAESARIGSDGRFAPAFSCAGPEVDLAAPGVAVVSCQSPDGFAAWDGTSIAAPHVAALAALVLGHHADFRSGYATRNSSRVERLFQILKETAQPLGDPARTGAGMIDAPCALGLEQVAHPWNRVAAAWGSSAGALDQMRDAMRAAGLAGGGPSAVTEPPRGPAAVGHMPLTAWRPSPTAMAMPVEAGLRELRSAMMLAGI